MGKINKMSSNFTLLRHTVPSNFGASSPSIIMSNKLVGLLTLEAS